MLTATDGLCYSIIICNVFLFFFFPVFECVNGSNYASYLPAARFIKVLIEITESLIDLYITENRVIYSPPLGGCVGVIPTQH